jgi:hypothetical protein
MSCRNDKVSDVLVVLGVMRGDVHENYRNSTERRKDAVNTVAESELLAGRYKNFYSARTTIHDACARRLKPDIQNIRDFDELTDQWLRENSMKLRDILLIHSKSQSQCMEIDAFFIARKEIKP